MGLAIRIELGGGGLSCGFYAWRREGATFIMDGLAQK